MLLFMFLLIVVPCSSVLYFVSVVIVVLNHVCKEEVRIPVVRNWIGMQTTLFQTHSSGFKCKRRDSHISH